MISEKAYSKIKEFSNANGFYCSKFFDDGGHTIGIRARYGDREVVYSKEDNAIYIENINVNGNFESFVSEMNLLRVMEMIGNMLQEAIAEACELKD